MKNITGAGIIIYYDNRKGIIKNLKDDIVFLVLEDNNGKYDFPKGGIEENEKPVKCAIRETQEECSLKKDLHYYLQENKFVVSGSGLVMYLANFLPKTYDSFYELPKVIPNPHSGFMEHKKDHMWLTSQEINESEKLLHYLKKYLMWAQNNI